MKIALDVSPVEDTRKLAHRVRGTGNYITNLKESLIKYYPQHEYVFFKNVKEVPHDVDIVHIPYFSPFFMSIPFFRRYKTVITIHDLTPLVFPEHFPSGIKGKIKWFLQSKMLESIDGIITDSFSSEKDILKFTHVKKDKIHVVYLAPGEEFKYIAGSKDKKKALTTKYNLPEKFVLYVGDVTWNKNLPRLVAAVKKINVPLVLVGKALVDRNFDETNSWNQDLRKVQELIKENTNILALGFVSTEDLVLLYNTAILFCMPSLYEGFGIPILEAMSCGCPVVTTKEGSLEEIGDKAAYYVDAYSIYSIAKGINAVMANISIKKELQELGLKQALKFSWKSTAEKTINVYEKALQK